MPRVTWPLLHGRPVFEVVLTPVIGGGQTRRTLLADTGAGSQRAAFELLLDENDCLMCGGSPTFLVQLGGAYSGSFPVYSVRVQIPQLGYDAIVDTGGIPSAPAGIDGIAGFRFLNRFTYGNFGDPTVFGLES